MEPNKVLVVEDYSQIRALITKLVTTRTNFHTIEAENGRVGLDSLLTVSPEEVVAVVLDANMPVMNGYEFAQELCSSSPDYKRVPIVAIGTSYEQEALRYMKSNFPNFTRMKKPFELNDFINCLKAYAKRYS